MARKIITLKVMLRDEEIAQLNDIAQQRSDADLTWTWRSLAETWGEMAIRERIKEEAAKRDDALAKHARGNPTAPGCAGGGEATHDTMGYVGGGGLSESQR